MFVIRQDNGNEILFMETGPNTFVLSVDILDLYFGDSMKRYPALTLIIDSPLV